MNKMIKVQVKSKGKRTRKFSLSKPMETVDYLSVVAGGNSRC